MMVTQGSYACAPHKQMPTINCVTLTARHACEPHPERPPLPSRRTCARCSKPKSAPYFWLSLCLPKRSLSPLALPPSAAVLLATRSATSSAKSVRPAPDRPALGREQQGYSSCSSKAPAAACEKTVCWCNRSHPKLCAVVRVGVMQASPAPLGTYGGRAVLQQPKVSGGQCV